MSTDLTPLQPQIVAHKPALLALKPIQRRAVVAIVESRTVGDAAEQVGRSERTLHRWLRNPIFRRCVQAACLSRELALEIQAQNAAAEAFSTLTELVSARNYNDDRLKAARQILEYADRRAARRSDK